MTKVDEKLMRQICGHLPKKAGEERGEQTKDNVAPGFPEALERLNVMAELREAADLWMHAYVGLYVIHYGPEKLASMMADPIEGKRIKETRALLERTATDVPW